MIGTGLPWVSGKMLSASKRIEGRQALRIFEAIEDPNAEQVRGWLAALEEGGTDVGTG